MSPQAQRIAIAEACGWTDVRPWKMSQSNGEMMTIGIVGKAPAPCETMPWIPDYLTDLNAMHEVEKMLDLSNGGPMSGDCLRYAYSREVYKLVPEWHQPFRATASQRAEAFLRTIDKWKDAP